MRQVPRACILWGARCEERDFVRASEGVARDRFFAAFSLLLLLLLLKAAVGVAAMWHQRKNLGCC